jgi:ribosomal protein L24E
MERKYVCSFCGKEFTSKEEKRHGLLPAFTPNDAREAILSTPGEDMVFCSRHCRSEYEHGKRKDW